MRQDFNDTGGASPFIPECVCNIEGAIGLLPLAGNRHFSKATVQRRGQYAVTDVTRSPSDTQKTYVICLFSRALLGQCESLASEPPTSVYI